MKKLSLFIALLTVGALAQNIVLRDFSCTDAGSTDSYACSLPVTPGSYSAIAGKPVRFKANTANTGASSLNLNGLGNVAIKKPTAGIATDTADNDIRPGQWVTVVYDGTNFQMQSLLGNAASGGGGTNYQALQDHGTAQTPSSTLNIRDSLRSDGTNLDYSARGVRSTHMREEWGSGTNTTGNVGQNAWNFDAFGASGSISQVDGAWPNSSVTRSGCMTAAATCGLTLHLGTSGTPINAFGVLPANAPWGVTIVGKIEQATNTRWRAGFANKCSTAAPINGFFLRYDTNLGDTHFMYENRLSSTPTTADSSVTADTAFHTFDIYSLVAGTIHFAIDGANDKTLCAAGGGCDISASPYVAGTMDACLIMSTDTAASTAFAQWDFWGYDARYSNGTGNKRN